MAKAEKAAAGAPAKKKGGGLIVMIVVALIASGAGFALPTFLHIGASEKSTHDKDKAKKKEAEFNLTFVTFGELVINPNDANFSRFLRIKLLLLVAKDDETAVTEAVNKQKPILRNWLIGYLSDKPMREMTGAGGIHRIQREVMDQFNTALFPDGSEKIREVLVDDFSIQ